MNAKLNLRLSERPKEYKMDKNILEKCIVEFLL